LDGSIRLWDADDLREEHVWPSPGRTTEQECSVLSVSPLTLELALGHSGGKIRVGLANAKTPHEWMGRSKQVTALAWLPDGHSLVSGDEVGNVLLWHGASGSAKQLRVGHKASITALVVWAPVEEQNARWLVSGSSDGVVKMTDLTIEPGVS